MNVEQSILSSFRAGIVAIRRDGTVAYVNPIGRKILGPCELHEGDSIHERAAENPFFRVLSEALSMNYLPTRIEVELKGRDGDRQFVGFTLASLRDGEDRAGVCAFFKDLTHVEMAEENEDLKKRLLLLGQMAANIAHEIRNPIAGIGVHCSILKSHLAGQEKLLASVDMMAREVTKVEHIIRESLAFVRPAELGIRNVSLRKLADGVVERFRALYPGMAFAVSAPEDAALEAEVDPELVEQAMGNIVANAVDACEAKGTVTIAFGIARHFSDLVRLGRKAESIMQGHTGTEEEFVRISIRDDGPGIPAELQEKIFVPFFTTRKSGTGIGLPMAQKIVHAHGGILDMKSAPGRGTDFIIKIPVRQKSGG